MRYKVVIVALLAFTAVASAQKPPERPPAKPKKQTETCFLKRETIDGLNKICFYDCLSGKAAITISSVALCPLTIKR